MTVADRVRQLLGGHPFIVEAIDETTAEVTYDPPHDGRARQRLHEVTSTLEGGGLRAEQVDMQQWTPGLMPGASNGTRTPPRARRIVPGGPPRLVVRKR